MRQGPAWEWPSQETGPQGPIDQSGSWQQGGPQPPSGPVGGSGYPPIILAGVGVIVVLLVAIGVVLFTGDDSGDDDGGDLAASSSDTDEGNDDDGSDSGDQDDGGDASQEEDDNGGTDEEPDDGSDEDSDSTSDRVDPADLPPPEIPESADPPPLPEELQGMTFPYNTFEGVDWPTIGGETVEVTPGEYVDLTVHLEPGEVLISFPGNDEIYATVEVYGPDGEVLQVADDLGQPGTVEWMEFTDYTGQHIEEAGPHVVRVIQHDGLTDGMNIAFFRPDDCREAPC